METHGLDQPHRDDFAHTVNGVPGRLTHRTIKPGRPVALSFRQRWVSTSRPVKGYGTDGQMTVTLRFDDECGNGHNTFSITADVVTEESRRRRDIAAGGCMHDEIAAVFPELAPLIRWHLCSTDGPMHYEGNTVYLAGDRDYNGLRAGERRQIRNGKTGQLCWKLETVGAHGVRLVDALPRYLDSDTAPACDARMAYVPWDRVGEGKARELDAARATACWPDATDAQLCAEPAELRAMLAARLPGLLAEFRAAVESVGFLWSAATAE